MNKIFTKAIIMALALLTAKVEAQMAGGISHTFAVSTATIPTFPNTGLTNIILTSPPLSVSKTDEFDTLIHPLGGWSFTFSGKVYDKCVVSSNGWLALIPSTYHQVSVPASIPDAIPNNQLSNNTTGYPIIAPLWDDIATSAISFTVNANTLWIRWAVKWDKTNAATAAALFFAKLDGTNNTITFYYANNAAYIPTSPSASIGIAGPCPGDFYSVNCMSHNAAFIDSVAENTTIGIDTLDNYRPYNCAFSFTPYSIYDDCSGNQSAKFLGTVNSSCLWLVGSTFNAGASGTGCCATADVKDAWFSFYKPAGIADVYIRTSPSYCESVSGTSIEVYDSCGGTLRGCSTTSLSDPTFGELTVSSAAAETLFVRVTADGDVPGRFQLCVQDLLTASTIQVDKIQSQELFVYPNPAFDKISLTLNGLGNSDYNLSMIDLTGRVIYSSNIQSEQGKNKMVLDVSHFSKGMYLIRVENNGSEMSKRVLIE